jgi:hypothetical protein
MLPNQSTRPVLPTTVATVPTTPVLPNGLSMGTTVSSSVPGMKLLPSSPRTGPATAAATTGRQRRERSRPSGTSRAGRVMPKAIAGAQLYSPTSAPSWARNGSGRPSRISWSTHGSKGMVTDQTSPEAANSQPIGLAGRRRAMTSPMVA